MNVVSPPSPLPYEDAEFRIALATSAGTNIAHTYYVLIKSPIPLYMTSLKNIF